MRITKIYVTKLFGVFNHVISLNMEDKITIIHSPNGFGKTALLRLINGFFNSRYSELLTTKFTEFGVEFDDNSFLRIEKTIEKYKEDKHENKLIFYFKKPGLNRVQQFSPSLFRESINQFKSSLHMISRYVPNLKQVGARTWLYLPTSEQLSLEDVFQRFPDFLPIFATEIKPEDKWLLKLKQSLKIRFIEVQRLLSFSEVRNSELEYRPVSMKASVATYSQELAKDIQNKLSEYGTLSQSLDRTFPARVINQELTFNLTEETLRNKLIEIEKKRFRLIEAGLLDKDEEQNFQVENQKIDDRTKSILSVYIEDVEKKLMVFEETANKIELFKKIINTRFRYKKMTVSKDKGFTFTTPDGNPLSPTNLSSGEQHELVMLYEFLFKVKPNSLILIDEPEISLHVAWQVEFLKDLQAIIKLANFDVLLATHSPDIIDDRWDLTVELKGPVE
ncbi:MAG: AAA family ATPase [Oscillatoriaceae cyanobacterium Prado104]|jgi:predicted ATP-binding protein involved in virulence|nr:AAA family ATPase [Oscillatoriaceae cyanobacterium Prado104]